MFTKRGDKKNIKELRNDFYKEIKKLYKSENTSEYKDESLELFDEDLQKIRSKAKLMGDSVYDSKNAANDLQEIQEIINTLRNITQNSYVIFPTKIKGILDSALEIAEQLKTRYSPDDKTPSKETKQQAGRGGEHGKQDPKTLKELRREFYDNINNLLNQNLDDDDLIHFADRLEEIRNNTAAVKNSDSYNDVHLKNIKIAISVLEEMLSIPFATENINKQVEAAIKIAQELEKRYSSYAEKTTLKDEKKHSASDDKTNIENIMRVKLNSLKSYLLKQQQQEEDLSVLPDKYNKIAEDEYEYLQTYLSASTEKVDKASHDFLSKTLDEILSKLQQNIIILNEQMEKADKINEKLLDLKNQADLVVKIINNILTDIKKIERFNLRVEVKVEVEKERKEYERQSNAIAMESITKLKKDLERSFSSSVELKDGTTFKGSTTISKMSKHINDKSLAESKKCDLIEQDCVKTLQEKGLLPDEDVKLAKQLANDQVDIRLALQSLSDKSHSGKDEKREQDEHDEHDEKVENVKMMIVSICENLIDIAKQRSMSVALEKAYVMAQRNPHLLSKFVESISTQSMKAKNKSTKKEGLLQKLSKFTKKKEPPIPILSAAARYIAAKSEPSTAAPTTTHTATSSF